MSCLPKPVLRGFAQRKGLKIVAGSVSFGTINASLFYFLVAAPRVRKFEDFFRDYDPEEHHKELAAAGLLQSTSK